MTVCNVESVLKRMQQRSPDLLVPLSFTQHFRVFQLLVLVF